MERERKGGRERRGEKRRGEGRTGRDTEKH